MTCLIINCNHWIGYHIVNDLLEKGWEVDGLVNEQLNDSLSLYYGRNSNFSFYQSANKKHYDTKIHVGSMKRVEEVSADLSVVIHSVAPDHLHANDFFIKAPLLFGEWMPMTENGMYRNQLFIPFNSTYFLTEAVYIKDFMHAFMDWLEKDNKKGENKENKQIKLEKSAYLRDNIPIEEKLDHVLEHYHLNKEIY
ncbi:hypothetical protein PD280_20610 [Virgibacillus salarius]|uniref:hypothetical protein n=1 Tax=Virgibacillus salarius TaxID=447199 RepID=UPI002492001A|nr:hypothetical protein [Virgibacillus salarius]WBX79986.1 hypothetical protein PD280_20610 [Virgibacillus salarius]